MEEQILFLESPLKEKIYGGSRIQRAFGFEGLLDKKIGEYWAISAHDNGPSIVVNKGLGSKSLKEIYEEHRDWFANAKEEKFPLLVKINEITSPVSVQVHPDDAYAKAKEGDLGKAEFCLFLDVEKGTKVIRGHRAKTKQEFIDLVSQKKWDELFIRKEVVSNDYVFTPAGVVHGVEGKMLMAEVQQSSDVTYRIYDYDNVDTDGKPRALHLDKALQTICIPHLEPVVKAHIEDDGNNQIIRYVDNEYFVVTRCNVKGAYVVSNQRYALCLVLSGKGKVVVDQEYDICAGMSFVVTSNTKKFKLIGEVELLISEPPKT